MATVKTESELKAEWGIERFVNALGVLSAWYIGKQHPISVEQMIELREQSDDAFTVFASRLYHLSESIL